ncbi:MAG: alpha/beta fold hydrolase [Ilumatobacteraceae bacterium]
MASFEHGSAVIHYDLEGPDDAFPVLLIAPGGMRSANSLWLDMPWNPRNLSDRYRVIGMDQRNAGRSYAPVTADDDWATYRDDQLALLDHLGVERCHVIGMCIGGPYIAGLLLAAPDRFASAVLLQPVGIEPDGSNRPAFHAMFDQWVGLQTGPGGRHADVDAATWQSFRSNMWDGEFLLTATEPEVAALATPLLVAMGNDEYHPEVTSRRIVSLAGDVTFVESWKQGDQLRAFDGIVRSFLANHTP